MIKRSLAYYANIQYISALFSIFVLIFTASKYSSADNNAKYHLAFPDEKPTYQDLEEYFTRSDH